MAWLAPFMPLAASAATPDNLSSILERAERGTLRAAPVIARARADNLLSPKDAKTCNQLSSLIDADSEVLYELLPAARKYVKSKDESDGFDSSTKKLLKTMLDDTDIVQARIAKQLNLLAEERSARGCP